MGRSCCPLQGRRTGAGGIDTPERIFFRGRGGAQKKGPDASRPARRPPPRGAGRQEGLPAALPSRERTDERPHPVQVAGEVWLQIAGHPGGAWPCLAAWAHSDRRTAAGTAPAERTGRAQVPGLKRRRGEVRRESVACAGQGAQSDAGGHGMRRRRRTVIAARAVASWVYRLPPMRRYDRSASPIDAMGCGYLARVPRAPMRRVWVMRQRRADCSPFPDNVVLAAS